MFAVYVYSTEWVALRTGSFLAIRGGQIGDPLGAGSLQCRSLKNDEEIEIKEGGFAPSRPGIEAKLWGHLLREGVWTSVEKPKGDIDGGFLVPARVPMKMFSRPIQVIRVNSRIVPERFLGKQTVIPVQVVQKDGLRGVIQFCGRDGQLQLLTSMDRPELAPRLSLKSVNEMVCDDVLFEVEVT